MRNAIYTALGFVIVTIVVLGLFFGITPDSTPRVSACPPTYYTLALAASPSGGGSCFPSGGLYLSGTNVDVYVSSNSGYVFKSWSGDITGTSNPKTVTMSSDITATALFNARPTCTLSTTASSPTSSSAIPVSVSFSESVTGFSTGDLSLTNASVGNFSGSGASYSFNLVPYSDGVVSVSVPENGAVDADGGGNMASNEVSVAYDGTPPTVWSIRPTEYTSKAQIVSFYVTFSEPVTGASSTDFSIDAIGITGASIDSLSAVQGSQQVYEVEVDTNDEEGSLSIDFSDDDGITDLAGNYLGGTGTGNGDFTAGGYCVIDRGHPSVSSLTAVNSGVTHAQEVTFSLSFTEQVTGLTPSDFDLGTQAVDASITAITGDGTNFTILVDTGAGDCVISLSLDDDDSIKDLGGTPLGGTGTGNGDYTGTGTFTVYKALPSVSFSASVLSGNPPLTVRFRDDSTSVSTVQTREWDFNGDGQVDSTEQHPIYVYSDAGDYTVSLTVTNLAGSFTESETGYITVQDPSDPDTFAVTSSIIEGNGYLLPSRAMACDFACGTTTGWQILAGLWTVEDERLVNAGANGSTISWPVSSAYLDLSFDYLSQDTSSNGLEALVTLRYTDSANYTVLEIAPDGLTLAEYAQGDRIVLDSDNTATTSSDTDYRVRVTMTGQEIDVWRCELGNAWGADPVLSTRDGQPSTVVASDKVIFEVTAGATFELDNVSVVTNTVHTVGTDVEFSAVGFGNDAIASWVVDGTTDSSETVTLDSDTVVEAQLETRYTLNVSAFGPFTSITPDDITTWPKDAVVEIAVNSNITPNSSADVIINANDGFVLDEWIGEANVDANGSRVVMDGDKSVTALLADYLMATGPELSSEGGVQGLHVIKQGDGTVSYEGYSVHSVGDNVSLTAAPSPHYVFQEWQGDASGTSATVSVSMDGSGGTKEVTAVFAPECLFTLDVNGNGSVALYVDSSLYDTYDEPGLVQEFLPLNAALTLVATPDTGHSLGEWRGDINSTQTTINLTLDAPKTISADFYEQVTLTVNTSGSGDVNVYPDQTAYDWGTEIWVEAVPDANWRFAYWTGSAIAASDKFTDVVCIFIKSDETIQAVFHQGADLDVTTYGSGLVNVNPPGYDYDTHSESYSLGTSVALTPYASAGWSFSEWQGDVPYLMDPAYSTPLTYDVDTDREITVKFAQKTLGAYLSTSAISPTESSPIPVTVYLTAPVNNLDAGDVSVTNGSVTSVSGHGALYTLQITPTSTGMVTIELQDNVLFDASGYGNNRSNRLSIQYGSEQQAGPLMMTPMTLSPTYSFTATLAADVEPVDEDAGYVEIAPPGGGYTIFEETYTSEQDSSTQSEPVVQATLIAKSQVGWAFLEWDTHARPIVTDDPIFQENMASAPYILAGDLWDETYWATAVFTDDGPDATITSTESSPTTNAVIPVTVTFSSSVTGFDENDLLVTNAVVDSFQGSGDTYSFNLLPYDDGDVTAQVLNNGAVDASDQPNNLSSVFTIEFDPEGTGSVGTLNKTAVGDGTILASPERSQYLENTTVTFEAVPEQGWRFDEWGGILSGSQNPTTGTVSGNGQTDVSATFVQQFKLHVTETGKGSVAVNPEQTLYDAGDTVTLTATPDNTWSFKEWLIVSMGAGGTETCKDNPLNLTMDSGKHVVAKFTGKAVARFSATPTSGPATLNVQFTDLSDEGKKPITAWAWDLDGDGQTESTQQNPSYSYTADGTYTVSLTVTSQLGSDTRTMEDLIVVESLPTADFTVSPSAGTAPLTVTFTDTSDPGEGQITSWAWDFDNDSTTDSTQQNPTHQYTSEGDYTVVLTVTNSLGSDTETVTDCINVMAVATADFTATPTSGTAPLTVVFTDASSAGGETITAWAWDFDNDGVTDSTAQNPTYEFTEADEYDVKLTVTTDAGSDSEIKTGYITVESFPEASFTASPLMGTPPLEVTFTDTSDAGSGTITSWNWDFNNDGHIDDTTQNPTYTYHTVGTYNVSLSVTTSVGTDIHREDAFIEVRELPTAAFTATPTTGTTPLEVTFTDTSTPGSEDITAWAWDFDGDDNTDSTQQNPTHTYTTAGTYSVELEVTTSVGSHATTKTDFIVAETLPTASFTVSPSSGTTPLTVNFTDTSSAGSESITSWAWDFDNDSVVDSTAQNPSWIYTTAGTYTVVLTVTSSVGSDTSTVPSAVVAATLPTADFTATPTVGNGPLTVTFTDASDPGSATITAWAWDFDNDSTTDSTQQNPSHQYTSVDDYTVALTVTTAVGSDTETKTDYVKVTSAPVINTFSATSTSITVGNSTTLSWNISGANTAVIEPGIGALSALSDSISVSPEVTTTYTLTTAGDGGMATQSITVTVTGTVASQPEGSFGAMYEHLIPADATLAEYDPERFAVITGEVHDIDGDPLAGVGVTVKDHEFYGTAVTDTSGEFFLPVEGGGLLRLNYCKNGYISAQRQLVTPWNDFALAPDVALIQEDATETAVVFDGDETATYTHKSTTISDSDGTRACTLVFEGDNRAWQVDEDGNVLQELTNVVVRASEFTTPESMPAECLPPTTAFTYCAELKIDGAERVKFDKPVVMWVDNFLGFDVGTIVPVGYYDTDKGVWVASENGIVVELLDTDSDGKVDALDADGDGVEDDLNGNADYTDEVRGLDNTQQYAVGATLWRAEIAHFSIWDLNFGLSSPPDDNVNNGNNGGGPPVNPCKDNTACYVNPRKGVFQEDVAIPGTGLTLHYSTEWTEGFQQRISIPVQPTDGLGTGVFAIVAQAYVGGRCFERVLQGDDLNTEVVEFAWDGTDRWGNVIRGEVNCKVRIYYMFDQGRYQTYTGVSPKAFGQMGGGVASDVPLRQPIENRWSTFYNMTITNSFYPGVVADAWTFPNYHKTASWNRGLLLKGNGEVLKRKGGYVSIVAGGGNLIGAAADGQAPLDLHLNAIRDLEIGPNGDFYLQIMNKSIYKISKDLDVVNHIGTFSDIYGIAVDENENLYVMDNLQRKVLLITPDGTTTTFAGNGQDAFSGDGGPALAAALGSGRDVEVDTEGNVYVLASGGGVYRVRRITQDGLIETVAGSDATSPKFYDGAQATDVFLGFLTAIECDLEGNLYLALGTQLGIVNSSGVLRVLGKPALVLSDVREPVDGYEQDICLGAIFGMDITPDGTIYLGTRFGTSAYTYTGCMRTIGPDGSVITIAGATFSNYRCEGAVADVDMTAGSDFPLCIKPDSTIYFSAGCGSTPYLRMMSPKSPAHVDSLASNEQLFPDPNGLGYVVNSAGLHLRTIDMTTGATLVTFGHDTSGRLVSMTDRFGNVTTIDHDASASQKTVTSPDGIVTTLTVDANNILTDVDYPDGAHYDFYYDTDGLMTSEVVNGRVYTHDFDDEGRCTNVSDPEGGSYSYSRLTAASGEQLTVMTTAEGQATSYLDYTDFSGKFTSTITGPTGAVTAYERSGDGFNVTSSLGCGTDVETNYTVDPVTDTRHVKDRTKSTPSGLGYTSSYTKEYDDVNTDGTNDLITETFMVDYLSGTGDPDISSTVVHNMTPDAEGLATITSTSPEGRVAVAKYDPTTLLTERVETPGLEDVEYDYDTKGRVTSVSMGNRSTTYAYDTDGRLDSITASNGDSVSYDYDPVGRVTKVTRPDNETVEFQYDLNGNMEKLITPTGVEHDFYFNDVNYNTGYDTPLSGNYSYQYDRDKRLTSVTAPSLATTTYNYNATTQVLDSIDLPGTEPDITFTYESCGQKVDEITQGTESIDYDYDGPLTTDITYSGTVSGTLSWNHNDDFSTDTFTYAGATESFDYNDDGQVTTAGDFTMSYNATTGILESATDSTLTTTPSFNSYGEIEDFDYSIGLSSVFSWDVVYSNTDAGMIIGKDEVLGSSTPSYDYAYDDAGRLTEVKLDGNVVETYAYDANGRRTSESNTRRGISRTYATADWDDEDRLLGFTQGSDTFVYAYDLDGFLTSRTKNPGGNQEVTTYDYSSRGELNSVTLPDSTVISYVHDPMGRRIAKKIDGVTVEKYLWAGMTSLLAVLDADDVVKIRFEPGAMVKNGTRYYLATDQVGSVRAVFNTSGTLVKEITYDTFGNILTDSNPTFTIPLGFAGGLHDRDTGLIRFGYRDYDPDTGRWTAKDPIGFAGGDTNLYGYCISDPVNLFDPNGLESRLTSWIPTEFLQGAANLSAGAGDVISFGVTKLIRKKMGTDSAVNPCSGLYHVGEVLGFGVSVAISGGNGTTMFGARTGRIGRLLDINGKSAGRLGHLLGSRGPLFGTQFARGAGRAGLLNGGIGGPIGRYLRIGWSYSPSAGRTQFMLHGGGRASSFARYHLPLGKANIVGQVATKIAHH